MLEAPIVGIPANPRSWVQYAVKSINALDEADASQFLVDEQSVIKDVVKSLEEIEAALPMEEHIDRAACSSWDMASAAPALIAHRTTTLRLPASSLTKKHHASHAL